jgi:hypothetical protein
MDLPDHLESMQRKNISVHTTQCLIDFKDLAALVAIVDEQMMFPSWRNANPTRTRELEDVLHRCESSELERGERCTEFSKSLREWNRQRFTGSSEPPRLSIVPEPE